MNEQRNSAALWPPQSDLPATMLRTCCHYCGQQVVGPAPALADWKWRHRLSCKFPVEHIHEIFWDKWAGSGSLARPQNRV